MKKEIYRITAFGISLITLFGILFLAIGIVHESREEAAMPKDIIKMVVQRFELWRTKGMIFTSIGVAALLILSIGQLVFAAYNMSYWM